MLSQTLKWKINQFCNIHIQGNTPNIFVFSTARSGSSWLMEMIATQSGMKSIYEPLLITKLKKGKSPLPPSWEFLLPNPDRKPLLYKYFQDLIHNKVGIGNFSPRSRYHRMITRRIVFKIQRCKDLMNWFEERFHSRIVYLVRHPVPTNLSRSEYDLLPLYLKNNDYCNRYLTYSQRKYAELLLETGSELQKKTLDWCLQNLAPLNFLDRSQWLCLHYEDLVINPKATLDKLADFLHLSEKDKLFHQYYLPSGSTKQSDKKTREYLSRGSNMHNRLFLINKWRPKVSSRDEEQVFEILSEFGVDIYKFGQDRPACRLQAY